jgi:hypothetical protein
MPPAPNPDSLGPVLTEVTKTSVSFISNIDALFVALIVVAAVANHRREKSSRSKLMLIGFSLICIRSFFAVALNYRQGPISEFEVGLGDFLIWLGTAGVALIGIALLKRPPSPPPHNEALHRTSSGSGVSRE